MRDFVPAIYDTTVIIPEDSPKPTMLRILQGQSSVVSILFFAICRYLLAKL
jgi:lysophosphatidic acid acyltransferase/lysophosphatidylinositol acyltransferase